MMYGLDENTVNKIISEFKKFAEIETAILYGSRAKGNFKPASDIDLTFKGEALTSNLLNKLSWALDDLMLPYTFDISLLNQISHLDLLDHINRVGIVVYQKNN